MARAYASGRDRDLQDDAAAGRGAGRRVTEPGQRPAGVPCRRGKDPAARGGADHCPGRPFRSGRITESGAQIRTLMRDAHASGAALAQFPEGAVVYPGKYVMSSAGPGALAEADWTRVDWAVMRAEAEAIASLAAQLGLWTVFGSLHPLTPPRRPHNSLYVISPSGAVVTRYDKRFLSNTEITWMYTPGMEPVVFDAGGLRFGCALCIEVHFPRSSPNTSGSPPTASLCPSWWTTPSGPSSPRRTPRCTAAGVATAA